jgi:hypothetical protein
MYNSIQQFVSFGINELMKDLEITVREEETNFASVSNKLQEHLNKLGRSILEEFIESIDDELCNDSKNP